MKLQGKIFSALRRKDGVRRNASIKLLQIENRRIISSKMDLYKGNICIIMRHMKNYNYIDQLLEALKQSDPYRIILFGSYSKGTADENSDIDMVVILDNNDVAKNYEERLQKKLYINKLVRNINYKIPLDILVYSREEYKIVKNCGNYFIDEIEKTGKIIYEKAS